MLLKVWYLQPGMLSLRHMPQLPWRNTRKEAQADLDAYAAQKDGKRLNRNEKAAMLAELKALMKEAHREARKPTLGMIGGVVVNGVSIRAVQAQRVVNAVKHVLSVGLEYSMSRKDVQILLE